MKKAAGTRKKFKGWIKYLLYVLVVTTVVSSGTLARYASERALTGEAVVALFRAGSSISVHIPVDELISPGSTQEVEFSVTNFEGQQNSEVALTYTIQVQTTENLPLVFELIPKENSAPDNSGSIMAGSLDSTLKAKNGKLPVAAEGMRVTHTYLLKIIWPEAKTDVRYSDEIDVLTITVEAVQSNPS